MQFNHVNFEYSKLNIEQINGPNGRLYQTPEGFKYPSITTVLSCQPKEGLEKWRERVGEDEADKIVKKAATQGTYIHKLCEDFLNNISLQELKFRTFFEKDLFYKLIPILHRIDNIYVQEHRMYSNHLRIAGTVDCVAEFDGKLSIIDFKNSRKIKRKEYIEHYFMQCAAYAIMFEERYKKPISQIVIIITVECEQPQYFIEKRDNYTKKLLEYRDLYEEKNGIIYKDHI